MANQRICSIPNCNKPVFARGWCGGHYGRWRKHGDPIAGGTARNEAFRYMQEVVFAYNGSKCLIWPYACDGHGAARVSADGKVISVARAACEKRHGPPPSPTHHAAHSCGRGDEGCVAPAHLRWATPAENEGDKFLHGTSNRGERHGCAKLTEQEARQILSMKGRYLQREIAEMFGVERTTISLIHSGKLWAHLAA